MVSFLAHMAQLPSCCIVAVSIPRLIETSVAPVLGETESGPWNGEATGVETGPNRHLLAFNRQHSVDTMMIRYICVTFLPLMHGVRRVQNPCTPKIAAIGPSPSLDAAKIIEATWCNRKYSMILTTCDRLLIESHEWIYNYSKRLFIMPAIKDILNHRFFEFKVCRDHETSWWSSQRCGWGARREMI